jgi:ABC-type amino acid transport system permease subunit
MGYYIDAQEAAEVLNQRTGSFQVFLIIFVIIMFFITVVLSFDAIFFARIRNGTCSAVISVSEAEILFWLNVVLAVLSGIGVLVGIFMIFFARAKPEWTIQEISSGTTAQTIAEKQATIEEQRQRLAQMESQLRGQAATQASELQALAMSR